MERLSIEGIVAIEPKVGELLREARRDARKDGAVLYEYKARLFPLVGWVSPYRELQDTEQYETVIKALCEALDC